MKHSANIGNSKRANHRPYATRSSWRALTLLEMVISLAIMAVIFAAILPQFRNINNSWASKQGSAEALQNGRVLTDHIYRNLMKAVQITSVSDSAETNGHIEFEAEDGRTYRYAVTANNYVGFGLVGDLSDLAGPVSKLQFTCYGLDDLDTPTTDTDSIRLVKVNTMLTNSAALGQDKTITTSAYLRTNWNSGSSGLVGWWKLDEGSGQVATDSSDNSNDGQLGSSTGMDSSDPTWTSDPQRGNVLTYDGSDDYIIGIGDCPTGNYTVAGWAKDTGPVSGKWSVVYCAEQEIWFGVDREASACIWFDAGGNGKGAYTAAGTWTRDVWHHLAATWDGSTVHIYLDGVDMPITTYGTPENPQAKAAVIGAWSKKPTDETWYGSLSDVRLYDQALTAEEIAILADGG